MSKTTKQAGFTAVEGIIIVLVVVLLGLTGWWVWHQNKDDKSKKQDTAQQADSDKNNQAKEESLMPVRKVTVTTYTKAPDEVRAAILAYNKEHVPSCVKNDVIVEYDGTPADRKVVVQDEDGKLGTGSIAETNVGCDGAAGTLFAKDKEGKWNVLQATQSYFTCDALAKVVITTEFAQEVTSAAECSMPDGQLKDTQSLYL